MLCYFLFVACGKKEGKAAESTTLPHSESQFLLIIASARQEMEGVYGKEVWGGCVDDGRETFSEAYFDELREFFYELSAMNDMTEERNMKLDTEEMRHLYEAMERFYTVPMQNWPSLGGFSEEKVKSMFQRYVRTLRLRKTIREDKEAGVSENKAKATRLQSVVCERREDAEKLRGEVLVGGDFRTLARRYCNVDAPVRKVAHDDPVPTFERVAFTMEDNTVNVMMELDGKYYMFKCPMGYDIEATMERRKNLQDERLQDLMREACGCYLSTHPIVKDAGFWDSTEGKVSKNYSGSNFSTAMRETLRYGGV